MSETLKQFLKDWLQWAEAGGHKCREFTPSAGLCFNVLEWAAVQGEPEPYRIKRELTALFPKRWADSTATNPFPFGEQDYDERVYKRTMHKCPKRLAWVREQLEMNP